MAKGTADKTKSPQSIKLTIARRTMNSFLMSLLTTAVVKLFYSRKREIVTMILANIRKYPKTS